MLKSYWRSIFLSTKSSFGTISLFVLLLTVIFYSFRLQLYPFETLRNPLSLVALFSPRLLSESALFESLRFVAVVSAVLSLIRPKIFILLCLVSFSCLCSMSVGTMVYTRHQTNAVNIILLLYAVWIVSRSSTPSFAPFKLKNEEPKWLYELGLYYLCISYSFSGITKLWLSGINWANGVNLQLWCKVLPVEPSLLSSICLYDVNFTALLQSFALLAEVLAIFSFFYRKLLIPIGIVLLSLHLSIEILFGFEFYGNIALVALFFIIQPLMLRMNNEK